MSASGGEAVVSQTSAEVPSDPSETLTNGSDIGTLWNAIVGHSPLMPDDGPPLLDLGLL